MSTPYTAPVFNSKAFNCPHCGAYALQNWRSFPDEFTLRSLPLTIARCSHCYQISCWYNGKMVVPSTGNIELPNADMPQECKKVYLEARDILNQSPRGAAALLRLCLQILMKDLGEEGKDISKDIGSLVEKGLSIEVQRAADICRVVGNNAVHPGQIDINDSPEIALSLFRLINFITDHEITQPKEINSLFYALPEGYKDGIKRRDKLTK